jgi:hypothetical protein
MSYSLPTAVERSILRFCEDLSSPRALAVSILLRNREWDQLSSLKVIPEQYTRADEYWRDASVSSLLRKTEDLPTSFDRKAVALENFWLGERDCLRTNRRLYPYVQDILSGNFSTDGPDGALTDFIVRARKIADDILGPCPSFVRGRFGPGATYGDRGKLATVPDKMTSRPTLTLSAHPWLFQWMDTQWGNVNRRRGKGLAFVRGNRFTTVPKDCTKDRGIAVEPSINVFYQLGYGSVLKDRLRCAGINLLEGQQIHRRVACEASKTGAFATLDLKNASDSVSRRLVQLLLPKRWFDVLNDLRSPTTLVGKQTVVLEKFSSMGNGFTFELETLIFLVICLALDPALRAGENVFVYGDDIIVPTNSANDVIAALSFFGLTTNKEKSFVNGWFRESCGGDYFNGEDVRPHFMKETPNEPQQLISLCNGVRRLGLNNPKLTYRHRALRRLWLGVQDALPTALRQCLGPEGLGDIVLHADESQWRRRWRGSIGYLRCYRPAEFIMIPYKYWTPEVVLATALYGSLDEPGGKIPVRGVAPRDNVKGYKLGWVPFS